MLEYFHTLFISPFQYDFFFNALLGIIFIAVTCGLISTFLILKGWSLYGDALSHAVLPGIIIAILVGGSVSIGIFVLALMVTFSIQYFKKHTVYHEQTVLSFVTSTYMGIGFLLYNLYPPGIRITEILFGKIVGLTFWNLVGLATIMVITLGLIITSYKTLAVVFFDRVFAQIIGLRIRIYELVFYVLLAVAVMSSLRSVGTLLIVSMLIIPGSLAYLLSKKLRTILIISTAFSVITSILGFFFSYRYDMSTGATIISMQFTIFLLVFFYQYFTRRISINRRIDDQQDNLKRQEQLDAQAKLDKFSKETL